MRIAFKVLGIVALVFVVNIVTLGLFMKGALRAGVAGVKPTQCETGDVNGDGSTSLGDAIYLLTYMFLDGPDPVACAGPTAPSVGEQLETALAKFMPRNADRVSVRAEVPTWGEAVTVLTVPKGKRLILTYAYGVIKSESNDLVLRINGDRAFSLQDRMGQSPWGRAMLFTSSITAAVVPGALGQAQLILEADDTIEIIALGSVTGSALTDTFGYLFGFYVDAE